NKSILKSVLICVCKWFVKRVVIHRNVFSCHFRLQHSALDGVGGSCSHTNTQTDPWWRVDLMTVYRVNRVAITNRLSSYSEIASRINGAVIRVGNVPDVYISTIPSGATASFSCGGIEGRYVTVHIPGNGKIVTLCEVEMCCAIFSPIYFLGNRAVDGAATQSSTFGNWFSEKAIDGNRGLLQLYTGCSSTLNETNPWWRVDLRHIYRVSEVVVTNRKDCCAEQINGVEIRIGNSLESNGNDNPICAVIPAIPAGESYSYSCGGMDGRYVNLIIPGDMKILTLCEVEVYGEGQQTKTLICFNEQKPKLICIFKCMFISLLGPVLKRSFVKMQFNSRADLTDPSIGENILKQVRERNIIVNLFLH
uniref:Fucolectin tachylectin-4 pentraxin-1 domain-containing protein n=1 Tax=Sinocyclocheilus rhinocerous TaxID=307959 RepID=A0A673HI68_9TELE